MMDNASVVTVFTLSGLNYSLEHRVTLFSLTVLWYSMILLANTALIVVIIGDKNLHEPMYIYVCNLCVNGLYGTAGFYPKFLLDLLSPHVISYAGCLLQGYVIHSSNCGDLSMLALMAYDRYVAICRPLVYNSIMTKQRVRVLVFLSWAVPLCCMLMNTVSIVGLQICSSHINKLYCVNWMVTRLTCSAAAANNIIAYFNILLYFGHGVFIFLSYMHLIRNSLISKESRGKFVQTCVPHLISLVVYCFTVLLDLLHMRFGSRDLSVGLANFISMEFLLIPPIVNPLIYGFVLTKVRNHILRFARFTSTSRQRSDGVPR
ncbi:olfactory receptor 5F1-like [Lampris incognitus]|uniref:olfactory receptor 5F1-like n=1 Tax=Lampris incognitus TaxID=2546036 RepID=UPI0024B4D9A0|nr:olfactory receptor 5F1-like [Lampris incognitus]